MKDKKTNIISYIGSKQKLLSFLFDIFKLNITKENEKNDINFKEKTFVDLFAGTCSVSKYMFQHNMNIVINDISKISNILIDQVLFHTLDKKKMITILELLDSEPLIENGFIFNELSINGKPTTITNNNLFKNQSCQSRMFFSENVGKKIDTIKYHLNDLTLSPLEKSFILCILLNYVNKNANTTSVFGAYLKNDTKKETLFFNKELIEQLFNTSSLNNMLAPSIQKCQLNALECLKTLQKQTLNKKDVIVYMDPPYNTRSYESNYHILDYIVDFNFDPSIIKENSKTAIRKGKIQTPFVSKKETKSIFKELIKEALKISNTIYISYNNEGVVSENEMEEIVGIINQECDLKNDLIFKTYYKDYQRFTSGENKGVNNGKKTMVKEIVWEITYND